MAEMKDSVERFQELFTEALEDAGQNFQAAKQAEAAASSQQNVESAATVQREAAPEPDQGEVEITETDWSDFGEDIVHFSRRDNEKTAREGGDMQARTINGKQVVRIEENILAGTKGVPTHQFIADYIASHIGEVYTIIESGQKVYIGEDLPGEYTQSEYTKVVLRKNPASSRPKTELLSISAR